MIAWPEDTRSVAGRGQNHLAPRVRAGKLDIASPVELNRASERGESAVDVKFNDEGLGGVRVRCVGVPYPHDVVGFVGQETRDINVSWPNEDVSALGKDWMERIARRRIDPSIILNEVVKQDSARRSSFLVLYAEQAILHRDMVLTGKCDVGGQVGVVSCLCYEHVNRARGIGLDVSGHLNRVPGVTL